MSSMKQNTNEWLLWRRQGIGASDVAAILNISPWQTAYQLWESKTGRSVKSDSNEFIFKKGHELEPKARAQYEILHDRLAPPKLVQREDCPWARASLDGFCEEDNRIVEIKYVGNGEKWEMAQKGEVPEYYRSQMMWQMYVTGADKADYVAFNSETIIVIEVPMDIPYIKNIVERVTDFWDMVQDDVAPEFVTKDYRALRFRGAKKMGEEYFELRTRLDELEAIILEKCDKPRMRLGDLRINNQEITLCKKK